MKKILFLLIILLITSCTSTVSLSESKEPLYVDSQTHYTIVFREGKPYYQCYNGVGKGFSYEEVPPYRYPYIQRIKGVYNGIK